ncbi:MULTISPECIES: guanitoxin biosynthesis heme-dependent pre-guanitoxin N-hydroxylase GntA [Asticcacaulis]|uniref:guanitoxin biosynthesis heme-dependent pre-guanitoxin N-hydroxylase GntA n=1 Tax=Asticcacaulis TaxID=76890 RepID=UPI001AEB260B|nr:guanitoxin biosynthesis heme-dependent pre-guanitoxin N-hydroxylase GntA [Asticcacaulis sp. BE141]MBP2159689.1 FPC/CPF motif-containing protein YcgG [Asticcacaulis solisilvae]MDR6800484.1 FPC/CPF motif-containing protein YcgG [Asticcacaulis sp. BE141]
MYPVPQISEDTIRAQGALIERFESHIRAKDFPCVGAKSALARRQMQFFVAGDIRCPRDDVALYDAIRDFAQNFKGAPEPFQTFVVLFDMGERLSEEAFETALWKRLEALEGIDAARGQAYDPRVSSDPEDATFSLSFGGEAFFVVGLHPGASRAARRFEVPVLVFNAHDQFETLRKEGRYDTMRETILKRDEAYSGSINPMVARHGEISEARQYSGRMVDDSWRCPMRQIHHS